MLTSTVCEEFDSLREKFPDELDDPVKYMSTSGTLKQHCPDKECKTYNNIVNGGFLWLLDTFYDGKSVFSYYADGKIDIVVYIMMWLGYKLNHKLNTQFSNINEFYNTHMKNYYGYAKKIDYVDDYNSYNDLINKHNYVFNIPNEHMSKFYDAFKSLCKLYTECDNIESDYNSYLEKTQEFVKKYEQLKDLDINKNESYGKLFSILSNDYDNLKNKCYYFPPLLTYSLISIALIFVAIPIFLGISYKYSLFGFRKRFQKQKLREKIKNIMKKMIH
ncbi:PIR protein [Plasmodium yoelii]|uniref:Bir1 protein n=3 Tax=Plasmodium yoelii TaxID=5861 RepID=Q7RLK0_PLAYO|nr:PIR protein [Plasmodium yoelii]EAA21991.1 putative bir1 protein [Plasmodium yoelii yoelii]WBY57075.1 PIR protein [Plasmodium yoelii yoelii]CDS44027.1 YIR protein [Plasmodium yoelii]VTZ78192.1 PIR protein [Plasmodium yoelii]|eukprot:XP_022812083.1 PIR protein [Plasmodium yoelii]